MALAGNRGRPEDGMLGTLQFDLGQWRGIHKVALGRRSVLVNVALDNWPR